MKYPVHNLSGAKVKEIELNSAIFEVSANEELVHQVVVAQDANKRQVIAHTKTRSEVRGGGRKPHRQKGTGRARAGSIRSPLWRGGGVTFGPRKDRNFSKKVNKKMKRKALFMVLSDRAASHDMILLDELKISEAKTKRFLEVMGKLFESLGGSGSSLDQRGTPSPDSCREPPDAALGSVPSPKRSKSFTDSKVLIVSPDTDEKLILSSRNLKKVKVIRADSLNVKDIIGYGRLVMPIKSLEVIERTYLTKA